MEQQCKLSKIEISNLCQSLALQLHAGVSCADALALLSEEEPRADLRALLSSMAGKMDDGAALNDVFTGAGCFPGYVCTLLKVGTASGRIEDALLALSVYYEGRAALDQQLRSALTYPCILLMIMLVVIVVLLTRVLPLFNQVYENLGGRLTGVAGGLLSLGSLLDKAMPVLCVLLALMVVFVLLFALSDSFQEKLLGFWREKMGDRGVSGKMNTAHFAQAMAMCLQSGMPMEEALQLSTELMDGIPAAQARCRKCLAQVEQGSSLAQAMGEAGLLPGSQCRLLSLGLKSGSGERVMEDIARRAMDEAEVSLARRVGQVEPALVLITSVLLGIILLSVMLPLTHIMTAIG